MTLKLYLTKDLEQRLKREAERHGVPVEKFAVEVLDKNLAQPERRAQLIATLQSWMDDTDDAEQKETGEYLVRVLDEDRLSDRKLFPPELKGITW